MNVQTDFARPSEPGVGIAPDLVLLPGEPCALYCFQGLDAPLLTNGTADGAHWQAVCWTGAGGLHALAVLATTTVSDLEVAAHQGGETLHLGRPGRISTDAVALAQFLSATDAPLSDIMALLDAGLGTGPGKPGANRFMEALLRETSDTDGFVEISVRPECGGLFLQGWSHTALRGSVNLLGQATGLKAVACGFTRDDILPPASGLCLFVSDWDGRIDGNSTLFVESEGRPLRLEILAGAGQPVEGLAATDHVQAILPRLKGPAGALAEFERICRPRFTGENTLADHPGATTAAVDRILNTPSGGLFVTGWLLDPLAQVERVILKSTGGLYAPLQDRWHRMERPDLNAAFEPDPRFSGLLDPRERLHGFVCAIQAAPHELDGSQVYLELVLADQSCLFLPCDLTPCAGHGAAHPVIASLASHDPALSSLISQHAAPFLETVPVRRRRPAQVAVQALGGGMAGKDVCAVMPVSDIAHLQPVMSSLAGTPEARALDIVLVLGRDGAVGLAEDLDHSFRFYGLTGALMLVPDHETLAARLDAGVAATDADKILVWQPAVLPKAPGWLDHLEAASKDSGDGAIVSPLLVYEDGSIYFGGSAVGSGPEGTACAFLGFERHRIASGDPRPASAIPAEIALIDRAALLDVGGFAGRLWGDKYIGQDLSLRLAERGARPWCVPQVEFWMLDATSAEQRDIQNMTDRIDEALIARRKSTKDGEPA